MFFKHADGKLLFGERFVTGPGYDLSADRRDEYKYPVDGWFWFDTEDEARAHFGMPEEPVE